MYCRPITAQRLNKYFKLLLNILLIMYDVIVGQAVKAGSLSLTSTIKSYIECFINRPTLFIILPIVIILSLCVLMGLHVLHLNLTKQALLAPI